MIIFSKKSARKYASTLPVEEHPLFKEAALKFAFTQQGKPKDFSGLTQVFIDSEGKRYFKYNVETDFPYERFSALQICMAELRSKISSIELQEFLEAMDKELLNLVSQDKKGISGASKIGWLIGELKWRSENLIHLDLLYQFAAVIYIRQDEDPAKVDKAIEREKIEQFKKDCAALEGGTWDFFFRAPFRDFMPSNVLSEESWNEYLTTSSLRMRAWKKMMDFSTSQISSGTKSRNENF